MVKISSSRNFQYKLVKSILLSILIPAAIILFSAWLFFGDTWVKSDKVAIPNNTGNSCKGMTKDKCNLDTCTWDSAQNMCLSNK